MTNKTATPRIAMRSTSFRILFFRRGRKLFSRPGLAAGNFLHNALVLPLMAAGIAAPLVLDPERGKLQRRGSSFQNHLWGAALGAQDGVLLLLFGIIIIFFEFLVAGALQGGMSA